MDTNLLPEKQKIIPQVKKNVENKPRLGQGRAGIKHKKLQLIENITSTNKSHKILKMPTTQSVSKNRMDFPAHDQSINSSKTEAIMQGMMQDKNREIPFYPNLIYRPPPRLPENLQPQNLGSKADTSPK